MDKYIIIQGDTSQDLQYNTNYNTIDHDIPIPGPYKPIGGPVFTKKHGWFQAMVLVEQEEPQTVVNTTINSDMDAAEFERRVLEIIKSACS